MIEVNGEYVEARANNYYVDDARMDQHGRDMDGIEELLKHKIKNVETAKRNRRL